MNQITRLARNYAWIHTWLGIVGNACFFAGSIMFLYKGDIETAGIWLFILGSGGMLIGSLGQAVTHLAKDKAPATRHRLDRG